MSQKLKFHKNHHAGIFRNSHEIGDEVARRVVEWQPKDAVDSEESERLCRSSVRKDRVVEFAPGVIAPRGVIWLMPDKADQLPEQVKSHPQVGPFFNGWYRHKEVIRGLEYKARTESEVMDKLKFATTPSELDDRVARVMNRYVDNLQEQAKAMNSSNGSGNES
ncbi:hypothetical protein [Halorarum halobium]|uniref:hypothetical protein n=1 Tax=Halorarum halobium TaxID=3075121 RepID=UPI0028AD0B50|nr:hypothetical protein [Halobaculum sp. XH14]